MKLLSKNSNLCDHNPPTLQTDRRTDRQTTCDGNTALCTKVHRAVKTEKPSYQICLLSSRQQRKVWNNCCNARLQTSLLQTYGLLTVLTLILWITGCVEYCSNVFIGNMLKLNAEELRRLLIEVWFGIQQGVADQAIDQWRIHLHACVKAKGKNFEKNAMMCCSTTVNNLLWNLHWVTFLFHNFQPVVTFKVLALVSEQFLARLLNFVL